MMTYVKRHLRLTADEIQVRVDALTCSHRDDYDLRLGVERMVCRAESGVVLGIVGWCQGHRAQHPSGKAPCICGEHVDVQAAMPLEKRTD